VSRVDVADESAREADERRGYGDALTQALTLVVAPVLLGLLGAFIDSLLDTAPLFLLALGLLGVLGSCVTAYYEYEARIARHDEGKPWARRKL
jgi:F0F1-type ATP synthase assembly protein I